MVRVVLGKPVMVGVGMVAVVLVLVVRRSLGMLVSRVTWML